MHSDDDLWIPQTLSPLFDHPPLVSDSELDAIATLQVACNDDSASAHLEHAPDSSDDLSSLPWFSFDQPLCLQGCFCWSCIQQYLQGTACVCPEPNCAFRVRRVVLKDTNTGVYEHPGAPIYMMSVPDKPQVAPSFSLPSHLQNRYCVETKHGALSGAAFKDFVEHLRSSNRNKTALKKLRSSFEAVSLCEYTRLFWTPQLKTVFCGPPSAKPEAYGELSNYFCVAGEPCLALLCKQVLDQDESVLKAIAVFFRNGFHMPSALFNDFSADVRALASRNAGMSRNAWKDPMPHYLAATGQHIAPPPLQREREDDDTDQVDQLLENRLLKEREDGTFIVTHRILQALFKREEEGSFVIQRNVLEMLLNETNVEELLGSCQKRRKRGDLAYRLRCIDANPARPGDVVFLIHHKGELCCTVERPRDVGSVFARSVVAGGGGLHPYMVADPYGASDGVEVVYFGHAFVKVREEHRDVQVKSWLCAAHDGYAAPNEQQHHGRVGCVLGPAEQHGREWFVPCLVFVGRGENDEALADLQAGFSKLSVTIEGHRIDLDDLQQDLSVFEQAWDKRVLMVEERVDNVSKDVAELSAQTESLSTRAGQTEAQVCELANNVDVVHVHVEALRGRVDTLESSQVTPAEEVVMISNMNAHAFSLRGSVTVHLDQEPQWSQAPSVAQTPTKDMIQKMGPRSTWLGQVNSAAVSLMGDAKTVVRPSARSQVERMNVNQLQDWLRSDGIPGRATFCYNNGYPGPT